MQNFIQKGESLTVTAPAAVSAGDGVKVGQLFGVAINDAASGDDVVIVREGVFNLPKKGTDDISQGDLLYWDNSNKYLTLTSASGLLIVGVAVADAGTSATTVDAALDGITRADQAS